VISFLFAEQHGAFLQAQPDALLFGGERGEEGYK